MSETIELLGEGLQIAGQESVVPSVEFYEVGEDFQPTGRSVFIGKEEWVGNTFAVSDTLVQFFGELTRLHPEAQSLMEKYGIEYREKEDG